MLNRILNSQTKTITFAAIILGLSALLSRVFGLIRNGLIAGHFGRGVEADVYFAAFRIPDFVYNILIAGGVIVAFLPLFSEYYLKNKEEAWKMANSVLNVFLFLLVLLSLLLFILTPWLIKVVAPGFSGSAERATVVLTRLMFLSPIFLGLSSIFSGILHYFNRFLVYSLAPILYNLGIIFGIIFIAPYWGIFGVGMGVVIGAFAHLLIQAVAALNCGFRYKFSLNLRHPALKRTFKLMAPRVFAVGAQQINLIVITAIASTIATGSIALFSYANDLGHLPIGIIAVPFALASFPVLSRLWIQGQKEKFLESFLSCFRQILFFVIPLSVLMFILRAQIVRLILGTLGPGRFDWTATKLTSACLAFFCIGIFAHALIYLVIRGFFALQDTKTPTLITVAAVSLNIVLSFAFVRLLTPMGPPNIFYRFLVRFFKLEGVQNVSVVGLPLAFSLAVILQLFLLLFFFSKKTGPIRGYKEVLASLQKVVLASFFTGIFAWLSLYCISDLVNTHTVIGLLLQAAGAFMVGGLVYVLATALLKSRELKTIKRSLLKQFRRV